MKNPLFIFLGLLFFSISVFAYELNGSIHDNGDGTFAITVQADNGDTFVGTGVEQGDDMVLVTVKNSNGVTYHGLATNYDGEEYDLELNDVATGNPANGVLDND